MIGRRPNRSDKTPRTGEKKNCMSAKDRSENSEHFGRARRVAAEKVEHQLRQDRRNQSEREHVERHRDENENDGGFAWLHALRVSN